jgi:hypothetical protein
MKGENAETRNARQGHLFPVVPIKFFATTFVSQNSTIKINVINDWQSITILRP